MPIPAPFGRLLGAAAAGAVCGAVALLMAFGVSGAIRLSFDTDPPRLVSGVFPVERDDASGLTFAWTGTDMTIRIPELDRRRDWILALRARSARPDPATSPLLSFYADGLLISTARSTQAFETTRVTVPARPQRQRGAVIRMEVDRTMVPGPGDTRALGVMLDDVTLTPVGFAWPPVRTLARAAIGVAAIAAGIALFASAGATAAAVLLLAVGQAAILSREFGPYSGYPSNVAALAAWIAAALAAGAAWTHVRRVRLSAPARFVIVFSAAALFVKLLVLLHPGMPVGDAMFHAHRFQGVLGGNLYFTSIAPGNYTFPYPPGFYLFAAPFSGLVTRGAADMALLRIVALAVDAVAGAALYVAVRRNWPNPWAGAAAVVLYQMIPLEFRVYTVGNLTNAFAQSMAVIALAVVCAAGIDRARGRLVALLTAVLAAAFLSHTSTFPLLLAASMATGALLRWRGDVRLRPLSTTVWLATGSAVLLAVALYYAHFGATYRAEFLRITTETATAAPDAGGRSIAARAASVPMYLRLYLGPAPLLLAMAGAWALFGSRDRATLAIAGWTLSCLAFLALGVLTPVDMRYYLASVPVVALAGAAGASSLWSGGRVGRVAAAVLLAAVCVEGIRTWYLTF